MEEINWKKERNGRNIKKKWKRETVKQNRDKKERAGGKDSRKERKEWNERKRWKNGVIAGEKSKGSEVEGDQREKRWENKEERNERKGLKGKREKVKAKVEPREIRDNQKKGKNLSYERCRICIERLCVLYTLVNYICVC